MKLVSLENLSKYNELLNQKTVRSVNSIKPDSTGNVTLGTEKSTFNKVVYDTGYFSVGTSKIYTFDMTSSDLENVSKDNVNIRLVAKVTTAHSSFNVGDIAQLSTAFDANWSNGNIGVSAYIHDNTLYIYSGNNPYFSIHDGSAWLTKANVQIKAVLTAFIPDDGSILLIAEDQTNTSKLIGLPDGTLTWKDKNLVRSVNGVNADANGNVKITTSGADLSGVVKSVNGIQPDESGSVTLEIPSTDGLVKSVNSIKPDENGNINLRIPNVTSVIGLPDYENPVTVYDVANKGIDKNINFDYTFTEDGYLHYRLVSDSRVNYDVIFGGLLIVNNSVVNLYERSRSPAVAEIHACINEIIPVQKGSTIHIDWLRCCADSHNIIEFFPLKNRNLDLTESSESHQSTDSINEISIDTHHRYHEIILNTSETTLKFIENQNSENNSNTVLKLELFIKQGTGTNTVIWPENIKWENGTKPVLSLEKDNVDLISLISLDNGQNFYGFSKAVWLS